METGPGDVSGGRFLRSGDISSGDPIRTYDLWVMSQPVAFSPNAFRLKRAAHE
jgi:hypothetical protein